MPPNQPVYITRWERFKYAAAAGVIGLLVLPVSQLAGKILILTSLAWFARGLLNKRERIV